MPFIFLGGKVTVKQCESRSNNTGPGSCNSNHGSNNAGTGSVNACAGSEHSGCRSKRSGPGGDILWLLLMSEELREKESKWHNIEVKIYFVRYFYFLVDFLFKSQMLKVSKLINVLYYVCILYSLFSIMYCYFIPYPVLGM